MMGRKYVGNGFGRLVFCTLLILVMAVVSMVMPVRGVYAEPGVDGAENTIDAEDEADADGAQNDVVETGGSSGSGSGTPCDSTFGRIAWIFCSTSDKAAEATDWMYDGIEKMSEDFLVINPLKADEQTPVYMVWVYVRGVTNVVFIILFLIVIYSQLTGVGISNYGIKKILPKMIVVAILTNLSYYICAILVDLSNVLGDSLHDFLASIPASIDVGQTFISFSDVFKTIAWGAGAVGVLATVVLTFTPGILFILVPIALTSVVAVATGLITLAVRQAVVALLIMVSPLAIVMYMLPNLEDWFKKWRKVFSQMLTFYPMFSILFGASKLASWAIMLNALNAGSGIGLILGLAVRVFPMFYAVNLMRMSGTVLASVSDKLRGLATKPLDANRRWAESHKDLTDKRAMFGSSGRTLWPSLALAGFLSRRQYKREAEISQIDQYNKDRAMSAEALSHYKDKDMKVMSRKGERLYNLSNKAASYRFHTSMDAAIFEEGVGGRYESDRQRLRLEKMDNEAVRVYDKLFMADAHLRRVQLDNERSRAKRMDEAMNAHMDDEYGYEIDEKTGERRKRGDYVFHFKNEADAEVARERYRTIRSVMGGINEMDGREKAQYVAATAMRSYTSSNQIVTTEYQTYFEQLPPTKDVVYRLSELTRSQFAVQNIDSAISGMRVLNRRGDTDLVREQLENILEQGVELGTHASQALATFLMTEVKDADPTLRRFGKYINLETAQVYNKNKRKNHVLTLDEFVTGEYEEEDPENPGVIVKRKPKQSIVTLMEGTSLDGVERTAFRNLDEMLMQAYTDKKTGKLDAEAFFEKRSDIITALLPQYNSAVLKYTSGSEALKSAVSFLTGLSGPKDDLHARWDEDGDLADNSALAKEHFRKWTKKWIGSQTPTQLLNMRSDFKDYMLPLLADAYEEGDTNNEWDEMEKTDYESFMRKKQKIEEHFASDDSEEGQKQKTKALNDLRSAMAGKYIRQILGNSGKLGQIYMSRNSGAANVTKDWVLDMFSLNDPANLEREYEHYRDKFVQKSAGPVVQPAPENTSSSYGDVYSVNDVKHHEAQLNQIIAAYMTQMDNDDSQTVENVYQELRAYLVRSLGQGSKIVKLFDQFYNRQKGGRAFTVRDLWGGLRQILSEPSNWHN